MTMLRSIPWIDGEDGRELRAMELVAWAGRHIEKIGVDTYSCPSQDGRREYRVVYGPNVTVDEESCSCPDHQYRGSTCLHLLATAIELEGRRRRRRRRAHSFECACCAARHPLGEAVVVDADAAVLSDFDEGELCCVPCGRAKGVTGS